MVCGGWWRGGRVYVVGQGGYVPGWHGATQGDVWCDGGAGRQGALLGAIAWCEQVGGKQGLWVLVKVRTQWAGEVPCTQGPEPWLPHGMGCALRDKPGSCGGVCASLCL